MENNITWVEGRVKKNKGGKAIEYCAIYNWLQKL